VSPVFPPGPSWTRPVLSLDLHPHRTTVPNHQWVMMEREAEGWGEVRVRLVEVYASSKQANSNYHLSKLIHKMNTNSKLREIIKTDLYIHVDNVCVHIYIDIHCITSIQTA